MTYPYLPHQQRVIDEKKALDAKLHGLDQFLLGPVYPTLADAERERLARQALLMGGYSEVLSERIHAFETAALA